MTHAADLALDTDGDGLTDRVETQVFNTSSTLSDTDGDSFLDRDEIVHGFNPVGPGDLLEKDTDQDGLSDRLELLFGTDPLNADTDGDGFKDGEEVWQAYSPTSTQDIRLEKSILIHLDTQHLDAAVMQIPLKSYLVSTGLPRMPTPVGEFHVLSKNPRAWSRIGRLWMPYWMHFSGRGHGIHELPEWPNGRKEGENHLGHVASHGCVRLGVGSAKELYEWTPVGTKVTVLKPVPPKKKSLLTQK